MEDYSKYIKRGIEDDEEKQVRIALGLDIDVSFKIENGQMEEYRIIASFLGIQIMFAEILETLIRGGIPEEHIKERMKLITLKSIENARKNPTRNQQNVAESGIVKMDDETEQLARDIMQEISGKSEKHEKQEDGAIDLSNKGVMN